MNFHNKENIGFEWNQNQSFKTFIQKNKKLKNFFSNSEKHQKPNHPSTNPEKQSKRFSFKLIADKIENQMKNRPKIENLITKNILKSQDFENYTNFNNNINNNYNNNNNYLNSSNRNRNRKRSNLKGVYSLFLSPSFTNYDRNEKPISKKKKKEVIDLLQEKLPKRSTPLQMYAKGYDVFRLLY